MGQERVCGEAMGCGLLLGHQVVGDVKEGSRTSREKALACSSDEEEEPVAIDFVAFGNSSSSTFVHPCFALTFLYSPLCVGLTFTDWRNWNLQYFSMTSCTYSIYYA